MAVIAAMHGADQADVVDDPGNVREPAGDDTQGDAGAGGGTIPGAEQLRQKIPRGHPRIWFRPGDFEQLRDRLDDPDIATAYQSLLKDVEARISQPVPKIFILDEVETDEPASIQFLPHALAAFKIDEDGGVVSIVHGPARADVHFLDAGPVRFSQTGQFTVPRELSHAGDQRHYPQQWHLTADFEKTESVRRLLTVIRVRRSDDQLRQPPTERLEEPGRLGVKIGETTVSFRVDMSEVAVVCRGARPNGMRTSLEYSRKRSGCLLFSTHLLNGKPKASVH